MSTAPALSQHTDKRALLAQIGQRWVREVARETSPYAGALFGVAYERQRSWSSESWAAVVAELDRSTLTIAEWLTAEAARR